MSVSLVDQFVDLHGDFPTQLAIKRVPNMARDLNSCKTKISDLAEKNAAPKCNLLIIMTMILMTTNNVFHKTQCRFRKGNRVYSSYCVTLVSDISGYRNQEKNSAASYGKVTKLSTKLLTLSFMKTSFSTDADDNRLHNLV
uniref:Uncharacterized protein n=1 Tax=Romanomermis culicivorax TaxID=13658 RepID=A0A915IVW0_ROMCU